MKSWFSIKSQVDENKSAEISIHDGIGWYGITAQGFLSDLSKVTSKDITLTINSPGGSVFDGIAIYNGLRHHAEKTGAKITVKVLGLAASIASLIAMAGDKIVMPKNSFMMIHSPLNPFGGNAKDMREMADVLDKLENSMVGTYSNRTKLDASEIKDMLAVETLLSADEAKSKGFADEVIDAMPIMASFVIDNLPQAAKDIFESAQSSGNHSSNDNPNADDSNKDTQVEVQATLAKNIFEYAASKGLGEFASSFLLANDVKDLQQAKAKIDEAKEIFDLCAYSKMDSHASGLINSGVSLSEARAKLCDLKAKEDEKVKIDATVPLTTPPHSEPRAGVSADKVYEARRNKKG